MLTVLRYCKVNFGQDYIYFGSFYLFETKILIKIEYYTKTDLKTSSTNFISFYS